eukprot:gene25289-10942_t
MADSYMEDSADNNHPLCEAVEVLDQMEADVPSIQETGMREETKAVEYDGSYEWKLENLSRQTAVSIYSPKFELGTYQWRIYVFPNGSNSPGSMSVFLDAPEAPYTPSSMSPSAKFKLTMIHHGDKSKSFHKGGF